MLVAADPVAALAQDARERGLADFERFSAQVGAVKLNKSKCSWSWNLRLLTAMLRSEALRLQTAARLRRRRRLAPIGPSDGAAETQNRRLVGLQPAWVSVCFGSSVAARQRAA